jgi:hypothetical protein
MVFISPTLYALFSSIFLKVQRTMKRWNGRGIALSKVNLNPASAAFLRAISPSWSALQHFAASRENAKLTTRD